MMHKLPHLGDGGCVALPLVAPSVGKAAHAVGDDLLAALLAPCCARRGPGAFLAGWCALPLQLLPRLAAHVRPACSGGRVRQLVSGWRLRQSRRPGAFLAGSAPPPLQLAAHVWPTCKEGCATWSVVMCGSGS